MKKFKIIYVISFFLILILPMIFLTRGRDVTSKIDNRMLANSPLSEGFESSGDRTEDIENFLSDRIGFRDKMILADTVLNDYFFREMVHPIYMYGKDGFIFGKAGENKRYSEYDIKFADFVKKTQSYCEERNIPFTFVFDPSKNSVLEDKLPSGYDYDNSWVGKFMKDLKDRKVEYVDNLSLLKAKYKNGVKVFNQKYNAGHWNDLGAFYGVNQIIDHFMDDYPELKLNSLDDFKIVEKTRTSLPVSEFPIREKETLFFPNDEIVFGEERICKEIELNEQYRGFGYYKNEAKNSSGAPRVLVFQGSYMNGMGYKFFQNAFSEYIYVHAYQNVAQFDYYMNLFQPDCVVFETAEYTMSDTYYSSIALEKAQFNPGLDTVGEEQKTIKSVSADDFQIESGKAITVLSIPETEYENQYVYLEINGQVYDFYHKNDRLEVAILNKNINEEAEMKLIFVNR